MGSCGYAIFKSFGALRFGPSLLNEVRQTGSVPQTNGTSLQLSVILEGPSQKIESLEHKRDDPIGALDKC